MAKNLRDIVKKNPTPARPRFGIDPSDPWSAKAGIYEADGTLDQFLSSRGINPKFVSKDTKISHAKSSAFLKWKQDHVVEEIQLDEDKWLNRFLSSRGLDPKFVTTDKKVSFSKSGEFAKWLRDHKPDERLQKEEQIDEVSGMGIRSSRSHEPTQLDHDTVKKHLKNLMAIHSDEPTATSAVHRAIKKVSTAGTTSTKTRSREMLRALIQKHSIPIDHEHRALLNREQVEHKQLDELAPETLASYVLKTTSKDPKRAEPRKKAMSKLAKVMAKRSFSEEKKPTALEKFRKASAEREKKHAEIEKKQSKDGSGMTSAIDRLEKHLNKENVGISKAKETKFHKRLDTLVHSTFGKRKDEMKMKEEVEQIDEVSSSEIDHHFHQWANSEHAPYNSDAGDDNKVHQSALSYLRSTNVPKEKHEKMAMHIAHKFHGSGIDEEVEQIDELKMSTVKSYHSKRLTDFSYTKKKSGETSTKPRNARIKKVSAGIDRSIDRQTGRKPTSEDVYHDPQAATQMPFDGANNTNDTSPMKREMSKSARIIKSLYKSKNMKEDMYDWEKDDKSTKGYGKKPKMAMTDEKDSMGENKPEAVAIMTGGKTLTGQDRDTVEIDPSMKKRTNQPDAGPQDGSKTR